MQWWFAVVGAPAVWAVALLRAVSLVVVPPRVSARVALEPVELVRPVLALPAPALASAVVSLLRAREAQLQVAAEPA